MKRIGLPLFGAVLGIATAAHAGQVCWTVEQCRTALLRGNTATRAEALEDIKTFGRDAVPMLAELLNIDIQDIRDCAEYGLAQVDKPGPEAVPALAEMLRNDPIMRRYAATTLGRMGTEAKGGVLALIDTLQDADADLLARIMSALGRIGPGAKEAAPALAALARKDSLIAPDAFKALGGIGPGAAEAALPLVIETLKNGGKKVRCAAAAAAGGFGPAAREAMPELFAMLKDADQDARVAAMLALGKLGPAAKEAAPLLREVLVSTRIECGIAAIALASIDPDPKDLPILQARLTDIYCQQGAVIELVAIGTAAVPALTAALNMRNLMTVSLALSALGQLGPGAKSAVPALSELLMADHGMNCTGAAYVLGKLGPAAKGALPALMKAFMSSWIYNCKEAAASAITAISPGPGEISDALAKTVKAGARYSQGPWENITRFGPGAARGLIPLLTDRDTDVRNSAYLILRKFVPDARDAVPALIKMLKSDSKEYIRKACLILADIGPAGKGALPALKRARERSADKDVIAHLDAALAAVQAEK